VLAVQGQEGQEGGLMVQRGAIGGTGSSALQGALGTVLWGPVVTCRPGISLCDPPPLPCSPT
jgi:hypothetical protein